MIGGWGQPASQRVGALPRWRLLVSVFSIGSLSALPEGDRALKIYHIHTGEQATIVFKRNGVYDKDGLQKLNYILRDWRKQRPTNMDPHLFDLLWQVYQASGATDPIHVVCGFRSPETNAMLRRRSKGVAQHSQHMLGKATDFFIPGVPLAKLREIGLRMQTGGVGYYPSSGSPFVHMDTGSVRMWPRMTHDQLARVFPNGKTLYVPSDGRPLPGYDSALAAYKSRKAFGTAVVLADNGGDEGDDNDSERDGQQEGHRAHAEKRGAGSAPAPPGAAASRSGARQPGRRRDGRAAAACTARAACARTAEFDLRRRLPGDGRRSSRFAVLPASGRARYAKLISMRLTVPLPRRFRRCWPARWRLGTRASVPPRSPRLRFRSRRPPSSEPST